MEKIFKLHSKYKPTGDQPQAIKTLIHAQNQNSLLLGVTGSGKTFTLANVIASQNKQVLILSPNKTLAVQLFEEFTSFFPENKVCYFVSYFDYFQPESYLPSSDTYIPKDSRVNAEIERLRIEATASLINRPDTIIVASVSAIYSLGNPTDYKQLAFKLKVGDKISRRDLIEKLLDIQYKRDDTKVESGSMQVLGNKILIGLPYVMHNLRIEVEEDIIIKLQFLEKKNYEKMGETDNIIIFPAKHFVILKDRLESSLFKITADLNERLLEIEDSVIRARLKNKVMHDINMLKTTGYCDGIENYSSYFDNRTERPFCLLDFYEKDFLFIIDESHIAIPQLRAMYNGDQSRKKNLIDYGFRLPSAANNRPLKFEEIEKKFENAIFVSATPGEYEQTKASIVAEQFVRPTGILDPIIKIHPREKQLDHLLLKIKEASSKNFRSLITVLTKKFAEELAVFLEAKGILVCYIHSDIKTTQRSEILNKLSSGELEAIVGINLLREGLDLPNVAFLAIMDADIEGFLRDTRSLIQTIGRAARNTESQVVLYADKITKSMKTAIDETDRRRKIQQEYNETHNITPKTVGKNADAKNSKDFSGNKKAAPIKDKARRGTTEHAEQSIEKLQKQMIKAAKENDFEKAIKIRELIKKIQIK